MSGWSDLKRILSGKALSASPEVVESLHQGRANFQIRLAQNRAIAVQVAAALDWGYAQFYKNSPAIRTVIDLIASNVAQLDLCLYEEMGDDERKKVTDHPALESLEYPNPAYSTDQFVRYMFTDFLLYGNAFATLHRQDGTRRVQFAPLPPQFLEVNGPGTVPTYYIIWNLDGSQSDPIPAEDMFHWRNENPIDRRIGLSKLETLRPVIVEEAAMQSAIVELAKSGMTEPTWIYRPLEAPEINAEGVTRLEEHTANRLRNSNRIPPLMEEGMELKGFGVSPKDAEMLAVRKYALQQTATAYGVPLGMVGLADDVEQAQSEFYSDTLPPLCEAFCRQLDLQVVQGEYNETDLYFEFDLDEKMMGDERLKALTSAAGVPPLLRNEARGRLNLPPVEGGDEPMTPANMMPGSDPEALLNQPPTNPPGSKPSNDTMPIQNPNGADQGGGAREGDQGVKPVTAALQRHYERVATSKRFNLERLNRELTEDLKKAGLNGDAELAATRVNEGLQQAIAAGKRVEVIQRAKSEAPRLAKRLVMSLDQLLELGLPAEALWEWVGFSAEEIDRMSAMRYAESLTDASNGTVAEDH